MNNQPSVDGPGPSGGRKRVRDVDQWAKTTQKRKRNSGKSYVSRTTKKEVRARRVGQRCGDGCFTKITLPIVNNIHNEFWEIGDFSLQNAFLQKCVSEKPVKRRRAPRNPDAQRRHRKTANEYQLSYGDQQFIVCFKGFLSILDVSVTRVRNALKAVSAAGMPRGDLRGHCSFPTKIPDHVVNKVLEHIRSFLTVTSHYTRAKSPHMRYLAGNLNIKKMYRMYLHWMTDNYPGERKVLMSFYRMHFRRMNLGFKPPTTDSCATCDELKVKISQAATADKEALKEKLDQHVAKAKEMQQFMKRLAADKDDDTVNIVLDLQQTLPIPRISTSSAYYLMKVWMYNLCIHDLKENKSEFFVWDEQTGGRGALEIGSCILRWIDEKRASGNQCTKLNVISDNNC